jgi:hypothetical protein
VIKKWKWRIMLPIVSALTLFAALTVCIASGFISPQLKEFGLSMAKMFDWLGNTLPFADRDFPFRKLALYFYVLGVPFLIGWLVDHLVNGAKNK